MLLSEIGRILLIGYVESVLRRFVTNLVLLKRETIRPERLHTLKQRKIASGRDSFVSVCSFDDASFDMLVNVAVLLVSDVSSICP